MKRSGHILIQLSLVALISAIPCKGSTDADTALAYDAAEDGLNQASLTFTNDVDRPTTLTGTDGTGSFVCVVQSLSSPSDTLHEVTGSIDINPNGSTSCQFSVTLPSGEILNQTTLSATWGGYAGPALLVQATPQGSGTQNQLIVDGTPLTWTNTHPISILSDHLMVIITNDMVDDDGFFVGKWSCLVVASGANVTLGAPDGTQYAMLSIGILDEGTKVQVRETAEQGSWADYALWMTYCNGIVFTTGERFYGPVFSDQEITFSGSPEFFSTVSSHAETFWGSTNACIFHAPVTLSAPTQSMQVISFSNLAANATLLLTGQTSIAMSNTNVLISNARSGWTNHSFQLYDQDQLIYVQTTTNAPTNTMFGDIYVGGTGTLNGRITLVSERDIYISNHLYYASDPKTNSLSDDALGMIARRDIGIATNSPTNLTIYAHIIATGQYDTNSRYDGSFGVINWTNAAPKGRLSVYGGIVQDNRGVISMLSGTNVIHGYYKDYTYDTRFASNPPPGYPSQPWIRHTESRSTNCWLEMGAEGSGTVSTITGWYAATTTLVVTADAATNWLFESWQGDTNDCTIMSNAIITAMDRPRGITAKFSPELMGPHGTPQSWLVSHGLTNASLDIDETNDTDGDGLPNWQEWVAGTDPTNDASTLRMSDPSPTTEGILLQWPSVPGKTYSLLRSTNLLNDPFRFVVATNLMATNSSLEFSDTNAPHHSPAFWRVKVE